jgi:hypothetical protein
MLTAVADARDDDLEGLLERLPSGGSIPLRIEEDRTGRALVLPDDGALAAVRAVPSLVAEIKRLRGSLKEHEDRRRQDARAEPSVEPESRAEAQAPPEIPEGALDDLGSLLSAPFRVSPRAAAAAKDDPLAALAVQVARATGEGAPEKERARLIAMAFAAAEGDLDGFWEARKSRKGPGGAPAKKRSKSDAK